jgi:hypothetical protein
MNAVEIRAAILSYMTAKPGSVPNFSTVGGYSAASPVFDALKAEGAIVEGFRLSATGKRMSTLFTKEQAHLSA